ncbi:MAG: SDR family NAD(P)-dependent oxidoreductase [Promethearchaeota archaeon]|jgi:3-oxoacyl-[acyl-carrier protein] reductase
MLDKNLLKGKKTIITGASYGIGKSLATGFADLGSEVGIISRSEDKLKEVINEIKEKGHNAFYEKADVSHYDEVKTAIDNLINKMGKIDIFINNAGVSRIKEFENLKPHQLELVLDVNLKGLIFCSHIILPHFIKNNGGVILNTSSIGGLFPYPNNVVYGATKAGVNLFTQGLAAEMKTYENKKNITTHAILPGSTDTPMYNFGLSRQEVLSRIPIQPDELIPYFAFYASDLAKNALSGRLVNIESFRALFRILEKRTDISPKNWEQIEPIIKDKLIPSMQRDIKSCEKLLEMLLSQDISFRKTVTS